MAVDKTDGCIPSKMSSPEEMEIASQDGNGPVSQSASSRGNSPGSGEASLSQEGEWSHQSLVTADVEGLSLNQIVQESITQEAATLLLLNER